ncbi:MAG: hypothetical protein VCF24_26190 [Candidatus Latescibacterota bacterium]
MNSWNQYLSPYLVERRQRPWAGEDPGEWFPMEVCFTAVLVADGATFSGWEHYRPGFANVDLLVSWDHDLPAEILSGTDLDVRARVRLHGLLAG